MRKYVHLFVSSARRDLAEMGGALDRGDYVHLAALGHRAKGSAAMVGAQEYVTICRRLEALASEGDAAIAQAMLSVLREAFDQIVEYVNSNYS